MSNQEKVALERQVSRLSEEDEAKAGYSLDLDPPPPADLDRSFSTTQVDDDFSRV